MPRIDKGARSALKRARLVQLSAVLTLCLQLVVAHQAQAGSAGDEEFIIRRNDRVFTRDGKEFVGTILSKSNGKLRMRIGRTRTVFPIPLTNVLRIEARSTPEMSVEEKMKTELSSPRRMAEIAEAALRRFPGNRKVVTVIVTTLGENAKSGNALLLQVLGGLYLQIKEPFKAQQLAESLLARKDLAAYRLMLGRALEAQGKVPEALAAMKLAYAKSPDSAPIMVGYAEILLKAGKAAEARNIFTSALAKDPRMVSALIGQGYVRLRQGAFPEGALSFKKALEVDSRNIKAKVGLAACLVMQKEFDEAFRLSEEVLTYDNRNKYAYGIQGYARLLGGKGEKLEEALAKLEESLRENPNDARVKVLKAVALYRYAEWLNLSDKADEAGDKQKEASVLLANVEASKPSDSVIQYLLAWMRYRQAMTNRSEQMFDRASKGFRNVVRLAPTFAPAHQAVGCIALRARKWNEADAAYSEAVRLNPKNAEYHAGKGLALLGKKRLLAAQKELKIAKDLDDKNVAALCGLGYIANFERNETSARNLFETALASDGQCIYAAMALQKLFAQRGEELQYLTFDEGGATGWRAMKGRGLKAKVEEGKVRWRGNMKGAVSRNMFYSTMVTGRDFVRLEVDLEIKPDSPASLVLRIASKRGSAASFYIEFGKSDGNQLAYRFRDYSGQPPDWHAIKPWPQNGKVRVALETKDLNSGVVTLTANGIKEGELPLQLKSPKRIEVGVSCTAPARIPLDASADNISLRMKTSAQEEGSTRHGELIKPGQK